MERVRRWNGVSDDRTKRDVADYKSGLAEILQPKPIEFCFNGQGGTPDDGKRHVGLSAQATKPVMPELCII